VPVKYTRPSEIKNGGGKNIYGRFLQQQEQPQSSAGLRIVSEKNF
jgi:hypothetical protein